MKIYEPRIFGFRVNERSRSGPRMQWLRMRYTEEDEDDDEGSADDADEVDANDNIGKGGENNRAQEIA